MADDDEIDIDNMDFDLPTELVNAPAVPAMPQGASPFGASNPFASMMEDMPQQLQFKPAEMSDKDVELTKSWSCVYPIYIDVKKSRQEGRKIPVSDAIEDPSAIYMVHAAQKLGFDVGLEPSKRHPRDPFNFGRLRIKFKQNGRLVNPKIDTKTKLYTLIAKGMADAIKETPDEDGHIEKYARHARSVLNIPPLPEEEPSSSAAIDPSRQIEPVKAPEPAIASSSSTSKTAAKKKKKEKKRMIRG